MTAKPITRTATPRKACNLSLDRALVEEARTLGLAISRAAEAGIAEAVRRRKSEVWREENAEAFKSSNDYVETHGLPLEKHRLF